MTALHDEIRGFLSGDLARTLDGVGNSDSLLEAGIIDSLAVMELVGFLKARFDVEVADDEMMPENFDSVDALAAFVARKRGQAP